jgi:general secretion pathway protein B
MSYILDALKKSEAERSRGVVPTLLAPQQTPLRGGIVGWVVGAALLVNAAVFAAWMYWPSTKKDAIAPPSSPVSAAAPPATAAPPMTVQTQPAQNAAQTYPTTAASISAATENAIGSGPALAPTPRTVQGDPTFAAESAQPTIITPRSAANTATPSNATASLATNDAMALHYEFSTHFYASDPSKRAVTLNGKRYTEGDTIDAGVRIKEITETGVVLDVGGQTVPLDVLQDWR